MYYFLNCTCCKTDYDTDSQDTTKNSIKCCIQVNQLPKCKKNSDEGCNYLSWK